MKVKEKSKNIIEQLKKVRVEKGITYQQIADQTENNGEAVSLSTIKQVFSDKDIHTHDYDRIIKPIARVVLGVDGEHNDEVNSYLAISEYKDVIIEKIEGQIAILIQQKEELAKQAEDLKKSKEEAGKRYKERESFYKEQIAFKDSQIKDLREDIRRKDAFIREILMERKE